MNLDKLVKEIEDNQKQIIKDACKLFSIQSNRKKDAEGTSGTAEE